MQVSVHFQRIKDEIISNLKKAKSEIKVAVAWLTDEDIIRTLGQLSANDIDVKIVISNSKDNFKNISKLESLVRNKSQIFIVSPNFLHHKFCIIDNSTIINGSYNWTYNAQKNEENILVLSVNDSIEEDKNVLTKFNAKFNFFCEKVSIKVTETKTLENFKENGKEATVLTDLDEAEILLRQKLENDVEKSFKESLRLKIAVSPSLLKRMEQDGGGVFFIKRLLHDEISTGDMKSGFRKLEKHIPHRVDLSLEYLVSRQEYETLFSKEEVEFCKKLMKKYNL
nr:phospholipase D-like domain-containing protein [uncultured Flavobacterium sp.]